MSSGRSGTHCCSSPARTERLQTRSTSRSATTPRSQGSDARPATSSSTAPSTSATNATAPNFCTALTNFWRSLSNLTINVDHARTSAAIQASSGPVSQAAPMRRVDVNGFATLMDYCTWPFVRQRRLHRRLAFRRQHDRQRVPAAVAHSEQLARRLDERGLEPGLLEVLDEEPRRRDVVAVDDDAVVGGVARQPDAVAVVGAPHPGVVDQHVVAVDLERGAGPADVRRRRRGRTRRGSVVGSVASLPLAPALPAADLQQHRRLDRAGVDDQRRRSSTPGTSATVIGTAPRVGGRASRGRGRARPCRAA